MGRNLWKVALLAVLAAMCMSCGQIQQKRAKILITNYMKTEIKDAESFKINRIEVDSAFTKPIPLLRQEFVGWGCAVNYTYKTQAFGKMTFNGYFVVDDNYTRVLMATPNVGIKEFTDIVRRFDEFTYRKKN